MAPKVGDIVNIKLSDVGDSPLIALLNKIGQGEVVHVGPVSGQAEQHYAVAFDDEHLEAIQEASNNHFGVKKHQMSFVCLRLAFGRPKDTRYFVIAFESEVTPV